MMDTNLQSLALVIRAHQDKNDLMVELVGDLTSALTSVLCELEDVVTPDEKPVLLEAARAFSELVRDQGNMDMIELDELVDRLDPLPKVSREDNLLRLRGLMQQRGRGASADWFAGTLALPASHVQELLDELEGQGIVEHTAGGWVLA